MDSKILLRNKFCYGQKVRGSFKGFLGHACNFVMEMEGWLAIILDKRFVCYNDPYESCCGSS